MLKVAPIIASTTNLIFGVRGLAPILKVSNTSYERTINKEISLH